MAYLVAVDIGGTFTDLVAFDRATNRVLYTKAPTTYGNFADGIMECFGKVSLSPQEAALVNHGTTLVINAIVQRNGARTALVTTAGFRDVLEIARGNRPDPFDLHYRRDEPLVPRELRFEVPERMNGRGEVVVPLDLDALTQLAATLRTADVESVAVFFMHSFANPEHEVAAAEALRRLLPGVFITHSTELTREWYEYERTSTVAANAYVGPSVSKYIRRIEADLTTGGFTGSLYMMGSNGGVLSIDRTCRQPIALVESGPVGGCIGAGAYARALGYDNVIAFDMGGTTAKCALVESGRFAVDSVYYAGGYKYGFPVKSPVVDIVEVGSGGGSIAWLDAQKRLHVGPQSAGSTPGPVCYGRGGTQPTVTDANLVLGRINAQNFLGGELALDVAAARNAIEEHIARPLDYADDEGVVRMADGILVDRHGRDGRRAAAHLGRTRTRPARFRAVLLRRRRAAARLRARARALDSDRDRAAGTRHVFRHRHAARGRAARRRDHVYRTAGRRNPRPARGRVRNARTRHGGGARRRVRREHVPRRAVRGNALPRAASQHQSADRTGCRCGRDPHRVRTRLPAPLRSRRCRRAGGISGAASFGFRANSTARRSRACRAQPAAARRRRRGMVYFADAGGMLETTVYDRYALEPGATGTGPALLEEYGSTTLVWPGDRFTIGTLREIRIDCKYDGARSRMSATAERLRVDPVTLEVIRHGIISIADQIDANMTRTAYSAYIYEYKDYAVGLAGPDGELLAQSTGAMPVFVADSVGMAVRDGLATYGKERLRHGDVVLCNHAAIQGQHLNNTVMYTPIYAGPQREELIGFFAINAHWFDIGGMTVGSLSMKARDIFMEGLQLRTVKLWSNGEPVEEMYRIIESNTRFPLEVMGDIGAQLAGCLLGRDLTARVADKYGVPTYLSAVATILDQTEAAAREKIRAIPDGTYAAESFLDDDGAGLENIPIKVRVIVAGDDLTVDFSEMADEVPGSINSGRYGGGRTVARVAFKYLIAVDEPANEGMFRPIKLILPDGKLISAKQTAPMSNYSFPFPTIIDTFIKALEHALPARVTGAHFGTFSSLRFIGKNPDGSPFQCYD